MAFEAPAPLNYMLNIPNPAEQLQKSLAAGMQIAQGQQTAQAAQDAHAAALQEQQIKGAAIQKQQIEQQNLANFRQDFAANAANPTAGGNLALMQKYPQYTAQITGISKALSEEEAKQLEPIHMAGLSGAYGIQANLVKDLAAHYANSKDPQQQAHAQSLLDGLKMQSSDPGTYNSILGIKIADGIGGEEYSKRFGGVTKLPDEILKGSADAAKAKIDSDNEKRKLEDDHKAAVAAAEASGATTAEKNLANKLATKLFASNYAKGKAESDKAVAEARKAGRDASGFSELGGKQYEEARQGVESAVPAISKALSLANQIRTKGIASGVLADVNKYWHRFTGSPNETAQLNQQFSALSSSSILGDMKGLGRITPAEIELFSRGVPTENESGETKSQWLETYAKVMAFKRDQDLLKTRYIQANGDLTPAKRPIDIDGRKFPIGSPPPGLEMSFQPAAAAATASLDPAKMTKEQRAAEIAQLRALRGTK